MIKHKPEYRIKKVMNWNLSKGINKESVVNVYRNLLKLKFKEYA
jgi:hypothetical protein